MKNIKARYFWIASGVVLLLAIGLIILITRVDSKYTTALTITLVVLFVIMTFLIQYASFKTFNGRKKKVKHDTKEYSIDVDIEKEYNSLGFKKTIREYGESFLKIKDKVAYKVVVVNDINKYYNHEEGSKEPANKELDKCVSFIGIELFKEVNKEALEMIPDYSFQVEKVYYTALVLKEDGNYKCLNYIKPESKHEIPFDNLFKDLGIKEVKEVNSNVGEN